MLLLELHFKVSGEKKKEKKKVAYTGFFLYLHMPALRLSLVRPDMKLVSLQVHFKVSGGKKEKKNKQTKKQENTHSGRNDSVLACVHDRTSLTHPDTKNV